MDRKSFIIFLAAIVLVFIFGFAIERFQPEASRDITIDNFPLVEGGWTGTRDNLFPGFIEMLNPDYIFSATYTNRDGNSVHLFFDYFAGQSNPGGPHSPRNCVPGSGWAIAGQEDREININGRTIKIGRFFISRGESRKVMDFWYLTGYGETANDYMFKLYSMISSLTFKPNDIAFVRIISDSDAEGLKVLDDFEGIFVEKIYHHLDFDL